MPCISIAEVEVKAGLILGMLLYLSSAGSFIRSRKEELAHAITVPKSKPRRTDP
ncbi:hypothetical protein BDZ45DRAFT_667013 [Acephala macrosclerotiorum]|nr:hypothetical protein BDZ45DRAFT_667013 [Acephala macrosclerotiorum]